MYICKVLIMRIGIHIKCKRCGYGWVYRGDIDNNFYACCPKCHSNCSLREFKKGE